MKRIALTGATGFIGAHLAERLLNDGMRTTLLVRHESEAIKTFREKGAEVVVTSFDNRFVLEKTLGRADTLVHCAGATKAFSESGYLKANVGLTRALLDVLQDGQKLVFMSSLAAAGPSSPHIALEETMQDRPVSHYGRSKLLAEGEVRAWGFGNANAFVILRPGIVYGPGDRELSPLFRLLKKGILLLPPHELTVSLVHVEDLVDAVMKAMSQSPVGEHFFVANDSPCTWKEMGNAIARAVGRSHVLQVKPPEPLLQLLAPFADAFAKLTDTPSMVNSQKLLELRQRHWVCSNQKIAEQLHWTPQISLPEGLLQTARWYETHRWI